MAGNNVCTKLQIFPGLNDNQRLCLLTSALIDLHLSSHVNITLILVFI